MLKKMNARRGAWDAASPFKQTSKMSIKHRRAENSHEQASVQLSATALVN